MEEDCPEPVSEMTRDSKEIFRFFAYFLQALDVGDASCGLGNEPEVLGHLFDPGLNHVRFGYAVKELFISTDFNRSA